MIYIMVFLLNGGSLPWSDFHKKFKDANYEFKDYLRERIDIKYMREFFRQVPQSLRDIIKKILTLQFDEEPPYDTIAECIKLEIKKLRQFDVNGQPIDHVFEWMNSHANRLKQNLRKEDEKFMKQGEEQYLAFKQAQNAPNGDQVKLEADENFRSRVLNSSHQNYVLSSSNNMKVQIENLKSS